MEAYESFAKVYDEFMDNVPYEEWCDYIVELLKEHGICDGILVDLGCGTGSLTKLLAKKGYDMIGIDNSVEMLEVAKSKSEDIKEDILYLAQDMRELDLYGSAKGFLSICDSMNYILEYEDFVTVLERVKLFLEPDGVFIFDLNTYYKYEQILGEQVIAEDREDSSFIWNNYFDEESCVNEYELNLFVKQENQLYKKYIEYHYQKAYKIEEVKQAIKASGLKLIAMYDAFTHNGIKEDSERIYVIVGK